MGVLDELGSSAKGMLSEGGGEKAILYVYLVDLFDDVDDSQLQSEEIKDFKKLEKTLEAKMKAKLSIGETLKAGGKSVLNDLKKAVTPGSMDPDKIGEREGNFVKFRVQYNPHTIRMITQSGRQERKIKDEAGADDSLRGYKIGSGKTKLSFELIFDDEDNMNAFMLNDVVNLNATNALNKGYSMYQRKGNTYSVRKKMDAIMSLLSTTATQHVIFFWSKMYFRGQVTDVTNKYTMFNPKGNPIRGEMHIEITQDANQVKQFDYDEHYWNDAFNECFKDSSKSGDGFAGNHAPSTAEKIFSNNNTLANLSF